MIGTTEGLHFEIQKAVAKANSLVENRRQARTQCRQMLNFNFTHTNFILIVIPLSHNWQACCKPYAKPYFLPTFFNR